MKEITLRERSHIHKGSGHTVVQALEAAEKDTKDLTILDATQNWGQGLNYTSQECSRQSKLTSPHTSKPCQRCRGKHSPIICCFKDSDCHICQRMDILLGCVESEIKRTPNTRRPLSEKR